MKTSISPKRNMPCVAGRGVAVDDGPRIEKRRFDVEEDEEHGDLVEADVDALAVLVERRHAALVRLLLRRRARRALPTNQASASMTTPTTTSDDAGHEQDGKKGVGHQRREC